MNKAQSVAAKDWVSKPFPPDGPDQVRQAFRIVNEWARAQKDWELGVQAVLGVVELESKYSRGQMKNVIATVKKNKHSRADILDALDQPVAADDNVSGASDIVGHPPDPPFAPDP